MATLSTSRMHLIRASHVRRLRLVLVAIVLTTAQGAFAVKSPNLIIVFADDLGYNDLGCFGSPDIETPEIDRMAREGRRFTSFYTAAPTCTPSRAGLMTGCYPVRVGIDDKVALSSEGKMSPGRVFHPNAAYGLSPDEITIAEIAKEAGYHTSMIGKWHLGDAPKFNPVHQGFDEFFGVPYSNDMDPYYYLNGTDRLPDVIDRDQQIQAFTKRAISFIAEHHNQPFFLYLAHAMPHTPLAASAEFNGDSPRGLYGDAVREIDSSTGRILQKLRELEIDSRTLVVFTSDNGPWLARGEAGGSAFPLRAGKGTTHEGGVRVPCVVWQPGVVPANTVCDEIATTMDMLPTLAELAEVPLPENRIIDGKNIAPLLFGVEGAKSPWQYLYYYFGNELHAVRSGNWKLRARNHLFNDDLYYYRRIDNAKSIELPLALYDLDRYVSEQKSVHKQHPMVRSRLEKALERARSDLGDSLTGINPTNVRPVGLVDNETATSDASKAESSSHSD